MKLWSYLFIALSVAEVCYAQVKSACPLAPDFTLRDQSGSLISLKTIEKSTKHKLILLSIFQTTCTPCIQEIKNLFKLKQNNESGGKSSFELVLIDSKEDRSTTFEFLREHNFKIDRVLNDPNSKLDSLYNISSIPKLIIVDNKGHLLASKDGKELYALRDPKDLESFVAGMAGLNSCETINEK